MDIGVKIKLTPCDEKNFYDGYPYEYSNYILNNNYD